MRQDVPEPQGKEGMKINEIVGPETLGNKGKPAGDQTPLKKREDWKKAPPVASDSAVSPSPKKINTYQTMEII